MTEVSSIAIGTTLVRDSRYAFWGVEQSQVTSGLCLIWNRNGIMVRATIWLMGGHEWRVERGALPLARGGGAWGAGAEWGGGVIWTKTSKKITFQTKRR